MTISGWAGVGGVGRGEEAGGRAWMEACICLFFLYTNGVRRRSEKMEKGENGRAVGARKKHNTGQGEKLNSKSSLHFGELD